MTNFAALLGVLWWLSLAFGSPQYLIYSDSYKDKKSGYKVFAWKRNILLPIESLATPVLLSSDYSKAYDIPEKYLQAYTKLYPYKVEYKANNFLLILFFTLFFIYWLSRSGKIVMKFEEAEESDSLKAYNDFLSWSSSSFIRRFHARSQRKLAQESLIALPARGKLRLNLFSEGLNQQGVSSPFLNILQTLEKHSHHTFNLEVSHFDAVDLAEAKLETSEQEWPKNINLHDFLRSSSAERKNQILNIEWRATENGINHRREWLKENGKLERFEKEDPKLLGNGSFICPKELVLVAPDIHYAKYTVQKYLHTILNSGIKRFAGTELVQINSIPNPSSPTLAIKFRCYDEKSDVFWCVSRNSTEPHSRRAGYEFLSTQGSTWKVGEQTVQGNNLLYYRLGIYFSYELIDKGKVIASGDYSCLPFSSLAKIPGLGKLALKVENNKYQIITSDRIKQKAKLSLISFNSGDKAMLVPRNNKHGYSVTAISEIPYGRYQLIITPKDTRLQKINRNIVVNKNDYQVDYVFWNKKQKLFPLNIKTAPIDARVRALNINSKYYDGMELKRGKYIMEVSAKGHKQQVRNVILNHSQ